MPRVILHVDMDAFFASVEQRDHPEYRGLPIIVGGSPTQRGVVAAASYEARKFKVRSAMPTRTAAKLCPQGVFVRPRMDAYRTESGHIMAILHRFTSAVEKVSVDEAYLDLSDAVNAASSIDDALRAATPIAEAIKRTIRTERNLTASIGIGSNKFLAKLGSDFQKPDGLTVILEKDKVQFLQPLSVRTIHGVGPVTAEALEAKGLKTIGDLQRTELDLRTIVGSFAESLSERAFGNDHRPLDLSEERKSISAETTFHEDTEDRRVLRAALKELATDVADTLRKHSSAACTIQVKVRYGDFKTLTRQTRVDEPISDPKEIYRLACTLLARDRLVTRPLRLIGIGASTLVPPSPQLRLPLA